MHPVLSRPHSFSSRGPVLLQPTAAAFTYGHFYPNCANSFACHSGHNIGHNQRSYNPSSALIKFVHTTRSILAFIHSHIPSKAQASSNPRKSALYLYYVKGSSRLEKRCEKKEKEERQTAKTLQKKETGCLNTGSIQSVGPRKSEREPASPRPEDVGPIQSFAKK